MRTKQIRNRSPSDKEWTVSASFTLAEDGSLTATYFNEVTQVQTEMTGITGVVDGEARELFPSDGALFFDQLEIGFAASTYVWVVSV